MNVAHMLNIFEQTIEEASQHKDGGAAVRGFTVYIDVVFYLISKNKLTMSDDKAILMKYINGYAMPELYRVSAYYRKQNGMPPLNYQKEIYYAS